MNSGIRELQQFSSVSWDFSGTIRFAVVHLFAYAYILWHICTYAVQQNVLDLVKNFDNY